MNFLAKNKKISAILLAMLLAIVGFAPLALADSDRVVDAPRTQTAANGLVVTLVSPDENGPIADQNTQVLFRVADKNGQPVNGLHLTFLGVRDYSGQVDKEHNGPRDPNVGPYELKVTDKAGEYAAMGLFHNVGHWYFQLTGQSLGNQTLTFQQRVQANPADNGGIRLDWIVWPSVLLIVVATLLVVGTRGEKIPVPAEIDDVVTPIAADTDAPQLALAGKAKNGGK